MQDRPEPGEDHTPDPNTSTLLNITSTQRKSARFEACYRVYILYSLPVTVTLLTLLLADYITSGTVRLPI